MRPCKLLSVLVVLLILGDGESRIHEINIHSDYRQSIMLSNFGLLKDGFIDFDVTSLQILDKNPPHYGLVLESSQTAASAQYVENHINVCNTQYRGFDDKQPKLLKMEMMLGKEESEVRITKVENRNDWDYSGLIFTDLARVKTETEASESQNDKSKLTLNYDPETSSYTFHFRLTVEELKDEAEYTFYFYRCPRESQDVDYVFTANITQKNGNSYLSAGEKPLTFLYMVIGVVYFFMTWVWIKAMIYHASNLFKIHYLMAALVCAKFLASVLHSVDFYFIGSHGRPEEAWVILWYIIHLVRGLLLFISLALIGMGFAFVKHVLSSNEKMVLMTVVPLQIIANVAYVIIDSSEEAEVNYSTWKKILIFVDLLCCGAIIFPVMWSIRHLQQATERSDNKATLILSQLKLFRQFYVLVVVYIYITRIALQFLEVILPFQYLWCKIVLEELATVVFFTITGFKFRPYIQNPYYKLVNEDEDDLEMSAVPDGDHDTLRNRAARPESSDGDI